MGPLLCNLIQNLFQNPFEVAYINKTLVTLIIEVDDVSKLIQFRPISLNPKGDVICVESISLVLIMTNH